MSLSESNLGKVLAEYMSQQETVITDATVEHTIREMLDPLVHEVLLNPQVPDNIKDMRSMRLLREQLEKRFGVKGLTLRSGDDTTGKQTTSWYAVYYTDPNLTESILTDTGIVLASVVREKTGPELHLPGSRYHVTYHR